MPPFARISVTLLCLWGVIAQTLGGGFAGSVLCIGCERTGWVIAPAQEALPGDCCADECESSKAPHDHGVKAQRRCGCLTVPLGQGLQRFVASPRLDTPRDVVAIHVAPDIAPIAVIPARTSQVRARAGPTHPPRLLSPSSRHTVLVI